MKVINLLFLGFFLSSSVFAGGYRVALQGQKALGMGHTGVAMTDSSEVVFFNPAGMVFLTADSDISAGVTLIDGVTKYQNVASNASAESDNPIGTPFSFYYSKKYDATTSYGLGVYTPYGNTVRWKKDWPGSHLVNNIKLQTVYIQPTISYKLNDKFSFGFGPTYVIGAVVFNRNLSTSLVDGNGERANVTIEASGIHSLGINAGFLVKPTNDFSIGVSYRSKVELKARNEDADFENIPASMQTGFSDAKFDATLVLPAELTVGVSYRMGTHTVLALDVNRTFWSAYENINVQFDNSAGLSLNVRNYSDANVYRIGIQQGLGRLTLRTGAYFDKSPISQGYYTPETARNDSLGLTTGASYKINKKLEVDFSLLYLMLDEFKASYDYYDQSGTLISFGGEYKSSVIAGGLGLNYEY